MIDNHLTELEMLFHVGIITEGWKLSLFTKKRQIEIVQEAWKLAHLPKPWKK